MLTTYSHQDFNAREAKIPGEAIQVANQHPKRAKMAKFAQRAKNVKLALNSKITHLNSRSQSALASNILVQHIEQPMHRYLFLRLMD